MSEASAPESRASASVEEDVCATTYTVGSDGPLLAFNGVYDNTTPSLRRVQLINPTADACEVQLQSPAGIAWMALRANAAPPGPLWSDGAATNTVAWAAADGLSPAHLRALRHMAANLEPRTSVVIEASGTLALYVEVRVRDMDMERAGASLASHATSLQLEAGALTTRIPVQVSTAATDVSLALVGQDAPASRERMWVMDLGDVVVGQSVSRRVRITNASALPCFVQLQQQDAPEEGARDPLLSVVDVETHAVVPMVVAQPSSAAYAPVMLEPHAVRTLELVLELRASCANWEQTITVANLHASAESLRVLVRANVLGEASDEALAVLSASPLDFGDCCGGQWTRQLLIIKNNGEVPLDVRFQTEKHVEATFQLAELAPARDSPDEEWPDDDVPLGGSSSTTARPGAGAALGLGAPPPSDRGGDSETTSSNASQAGSRPASPSQDESREWTTAPSASIAPDAAPSAREPRRMASYSVSALTTHTRTPLRRNLDPMAMLRGQGESQHNQLEELVLRPGAEYRVVVSYCPPREAVDATYSAGRLKHTTFCVFLDYARSTDNARAHSGMQRRTIPCHTRTCTPFISVDPKVVELGMAGVGTRRTAHITVTNHSELSTRILMRFVSKVLSMYMDEISIPARQTIEVKMDFFPRRANEAYRKQITVMNLLNRHNDQIFEVRARNVDLQRVSFHSLFYRMLTPSGANYLDFGDVNIHTPRVRSFAIENLCVKRLLLEMSVSHPEDLALYVKRTTAQAVVPEPSVARPRSGTERKERFLETISTDASTLARQERVPDAAKRAPKQERTPVKMPNLLHALKRGSRGYATQPYGHTLTFKDRTLLAPLEYLDLATGPPRDALRLSAKSRRLQRQAKAQPAPKTPPRPATPLPKPALSAQWHAPPVLTNPVDVSQLDVDALLAALTNQSPTLSTFFLRGLEAEERLVRTEINLQRALREAIESGQLVPIGMLDIAPHSAMQVIAVYTPNGSTRPHIQGNARKQDSRIFLRLLEFDERRAASFPEFQALRARPIDELPVRDLMVRSSVCRSMMELGQPHINFGHMDKGDVRERKIWIQNRSEWALRYAIRKSGSIASGDIRLGLGRYGVVPSYGKRGVDFTFAPSLSGPFCEKLVVENIADHDNDQVVVLKASVRKVPNFAIDPSSLDFGTCRIGHVSMPESVLITNTTQKTRTLVVRVDDTQHVAIPTDVLVATASSAATRRALSHAEEEEVETLLQKLKIARRKGNADKLAKYEDRLTGLGVPIPSEGGADDPPDTPLEDEARHDATLVWPATRAQETTQSSITVHLAPHQSQKLLLRVRVPRPGAIGHVTVAIQIHEVKNSDETRTVAVHALVEG